MGWRFLLGSTLMFILGVALLGACGGGCGIYVQEALDIRGASNTECSLTINAGNNATFDIPAPSPAVLDTSLAPRNPPQSFIRVDDACPNGQKVSLSTSVLTFVRTSNTLCVTSTNELGPALGTTDCRNIALTLVCAGTTLYDHVPINACSCQG